MGFADEVENNLSRVSKLLRDQTNDPLVTLEVGTSDGCNIQDEIAETDRKIENLIRQLKANEDLKKQLRKDVAEKKCKLEKLDADLRLKEEEAATDKQNLALLEVKKLQASAGFSAKDALFKEELVYKISAYFHLTGVNFTTPPHEGYTVNRITKKAKFFQVPKRVPKQAATEAIWSAIKSTAQFI